MRENLLQGRTLGIIVKAAIAANVCYFAGPILETYVLWLGYNRSWVRWFLFLGGMLLTAILATLVLRRPFVPWQG
ncbi:hypothetical protein [Planctomycetes bacterium CA13]|uniref:hypothetical protein n=1 Tax=Novipirellula herctigrandis TaxID=2527986 RepID=UPI0011B3E5F8